MRGSNSYEELKELDDYAYMLGIEMMPCIQTLSHLAKVFRWRTFSNLKDTLNTLMCGEDEVDKFIEAMIVSATKPFRSNMIHIGMDETGDLGTGNYLRENGYTSPTELMKMHL